jgi:peptide/nickel transport system permease protein
MTGLARRLAGKIVAGLVMIWIAATFTFFLVHALPGKPGDVQYENYIIQGMSPDEARARVNAIFGFASTDPLIGQYGHYMGQLLHGDLGQSISQTGVPVGHLIWSALPWTVIPVLFGLLVSFLVGVAVGVLAAVKRSSRWGGLLSLSGSLAAGVPSFVLALLLLLLFHTEWQLLPDAGTSDIQYDPGWNAPYIGSVVQHAVLPVCTYALLTYGGWLLAMKSSVVSVLGDDFILASELRGIAPVTRARYIGRNAILPLFTVLAITMGVLFGGSVLIENTFDYPGLGSLLLRSIGTRDYPVMTGTFLLITTAIIAANILADLCYTLIDPRVRR